MLGGITFGKHFTWILSVLTTMADVLIALGISGFTLFHLSPRDLFNPLYPSVHYQIVRTIYHDVVPEILMPESRFQFGQSSRVSSLRVWPYIYSLLPPLMLRPDSGWGGQEWAQTLWRTLLSPCPCVGISITKERASHSEFVLSSPQRV